MMTKWRRLLIFSLTTVTPLLDDECIAAPEMLPKFREDINPGFIMRLCTRFKQNRTEFFFTQELQRC